jgi:hypothetical protein
MAWTSGVTVARVLSPATDPTALADVLQTAAALAPPCLFFVLFAGRLRALAGQAEAADSAAARRVVINMVQGALIE